MNRPLLLLALLVGPSLFACAGSIDGEVNGETVPPIQTAIFRSKDLEGVRVDEVLLATYPDGCARLEAYRQEAPDDVEERQRLEAEHFGEDYWYAHLFLATPSSGDPQGQRAELVYPMPPGADAHGELVLRHRDVMAESDELYGKTSTYPATRGELRIERYVEQEILDVTGTAQLPREDGTLDEVSISFHATWCADL